MVIPGCMFPGQKPIPESILLKRLTPNTVEVADLQPAEDPGVRLPVTDEF
jgi:hypothetical protein